MARHPASAPPAVRSDEADAGSSSGHTVERTPRTAPGRSVTGRGSRGRTAPAPAAPGENLVLLGEFGRPHGLHGELRLKSYTGDPLAIAGYGPLTAVDGRRFVLAEAKPAPGAAPDLLLVRVEGVRDRTGAEALNRLTLHCPRARLGEPEDEDEVFTADLVGLAAVDAEGETVGTIVAVPNYGGGDLLEIRPATGGPTALLPFTRAFVPVLDLANKRLVVVPPDDLFAAPGRRPPDEPA